MLCGKAVLGYRYDNPEIAMAIQRLMICMLSWLGFKVVHFIYNSKQTELMVKRKHLSVDFHLATSYFCILVIQ